MVKYLASIRKGKALNGEKNCWQQDIRKKEYLFLVVQGFGLLFLLAFLFYDTLFAAILLSPFLILYMRLALKELGEKKKREFLVQFKDSMQILSAALRVGYSVENAIRETAKDLERLYPKDSRIGREYRKMVHQLELNFTAEEVLKTFATQVQIEDVENFVLVFSVAKRMGGDSIEIIRETATSISEKIELEKEIQTILAAKKFEFKIMSFTPLVIILYMRLSFGSFMDTLYGNLLGMGVMTACLVIYIGAYLLGHKMVSIEI